MKLWELACKHVVWLYRIIFIVGVSLFLLSWVCKVLSWQSFLSSFPAAASIAAAYLWIRLDVWRADETISKFDNLEKIVADLISRRADCRVALALLILISFVQFILNKPAINCLVSFSELCILVPLGNWIARKIEKDFKKAYFGHN